MLATNGEQIPKQMQNFSIITNNKPNQTPTIMKKSLLFIITLILFGLSCTQPEIESPLSVFEQTAIQLRKQGYIAEYIQDKDIILISSTLDINEMALEVNTIFELINHPEHKLFTNKTFPAARIQDVKCSHASDYYQSGGSTCVNYLCVADSSYSILWYYDCYGGTCYSISTSCW